MSFDTLLWSHQLAPRSGSKQNHWLGQCHLSNSISLSIIFSLAIFAHTFLDEIDVVIV